MAKSSTLRLISKKRKHVQNKPRTCLNAKSLQILNLKYPHWNGVQARVSRVKKCHAQSQSNKQVDKNKGDSVQMKRGPLSEWEN